MSLWSLQSRHVPIEGWAPRELDQKPRAGHLDAGPIATTLRKINEKPTGSDRDGI